jgi:hypothetical protein
VPPETTPAGTPSAADTAPAGADSTPPAKPARQPAEIVRDIEAERAHLVDSVDSLKAEVRAVKEKVLAPRTLGVVGGVIGGFILLRVLRRRRHRH